MELFSKRIRQLTLLLLFDLGLEEDIFNLAMYYGEYLKGKLET